MPTVIMKDDKPVGSIKENDSIIFFNFRPDRARQITRALVCEEFDGFKEKILKLLCMLNRVRYNYRECAYSIWTSIFSQHFR